MHDLDSVRCALQSEHALDPLNLSDYICYIYNYIYKLCYICYIIIYINYAIYAIYKLYINYAIYAIYIYINYAIYAIYMVGLQFNYRRHIERVD